MTTDDMPVQATAPQRPEFPGNRRRFRAGDPIPALQFGQHGELTPKTIKQANLTKEEEKRAFEMVKVQAAYLEILDCLNYPVDPEGHTHDLSAITPTKIAIAWTLALAGFRHSGKKYIKKRAFTAPGCYEDAHTWVDTRAPDDAAQELAPQHRAGDPRLPPDTRRLAALRDDSPPQDLGEGWHVKPKVFIDDEPRPEGL